MENQGRKSGERADTQDRRPAADAGSTPTCRCKEVSQEKVPGLIRMMLNDLAFWKKKKSATPSEKQDPSGQDK